MATVFFFISGGAIWWYGGSWIGVPLSTPEALGLLFPSLHIAQLVNDLPEMQKTWL